MTAKTKLFGLSNDVYLNDRQYDRLHDSINGSGDDVALVDNETFTIGDNPKVSDEPLEDGTYGYVFDFITPTGDYSMSDLATYELKNGNITTTVYE